MTAKDVMRILKANGWKLSRIESSHHIFVKPGYRPVPVPLHGNKDIGNFAKVILKQFPDTSLNDLIIITQRYKKADSWLDNHVITEITFNNLQDMMIDGKFISKYVPFKDLIINE